MPTIPRASASIAHRSRGAVHRAKPSYLVEIRVSPLPPHSSPLTWGENSPDEQFALGAPEPGWRQSRAVRLACPLFGCPFSGLRYPGRGRRDALPYFEVHGEGARPCVARDACTPRFVADRGLTSSKPPSGIPAAFQQTGAPIGRAS